MVCVAAAREAVQVAARPDEVWVEVWAEAWVEAWAEACGGAWAEPWAQVRAEVRTEVQAEKMKIVYFSSCRVICIRHSLLHAFLLHLHVALVST